MRVTVEELRKVYEKNPKSRALRIEWLLQRRDAMQEETVDDAIEFAFIQEELCRLLGARICILATKKELSG